MIETTRSSGWVGTVIRLAGLFVFGLVIGRGLTLTALAAYGETSKVYWGTFTTSCQNCSPTIDESAWSSSSGLGATKPWSVIRGNPGCATGNGSINSATSNLTGGTYYVRVKLDLGNAFCSGTVKWRVAWEHQ